jgi:hypothetical protein
MIIVTTDSCLVWKAFEDDRFDISRQAIDIVSDCDISDKNQSIVESQKQFVHVQEMENLLDIWRWLPLRG